MTIKILLLLTIPALFASCASSGKVTGDFAQQRLVFGNGGGFTGIYTSYELNDEGTVFTLLPDSSLQKVNRIRKKQTRALFTQADKLITAHPAFNHPGNITWFIKYYKGNKLHEFKWGDHTMPVSSEIKDFYNQLITIVN